MAKSTPISSLTAWQIHDHMLSAHVPRMLTYGPPGIGKSYGPAKWAAKNRWEFMSVTLTDQTPASELRGHFILKGSDFVWHDGVVTRAWRKTQEGLNVLIEINEIVEAGADVEVFLHNALDDPEFARLDLPTGETIRPAPERLIVVATMNGNPGMIREALRDRFPVKIQLNEPHPDAIMALPSDLRPLAMEMTKASKGKDRMSVRPFVAYAQLRSRVAANIAAEAVFGENALDILTALGLSTIKAPK